MTYKLRPYQQGAVDAAISHLKKTTISILIEAATGAGKSLIVAEIAKWLNHKSGKKVLCLAPSKELTEQNHEKYLAYGEPASIWSASAGQKCLKHGVVFGTPQSVKNDLGKFGEQFCAVVIDEAHGITNTIKSIVNHLKQCNPNLRVIGLTATPYRMNTGYIYQVTQNDTQLNEEQAINPYFDKLIYRITAQELVEQGYLTTPIADAEIAEKYDTSCIVTKRNGQFDQASIEQAFEGKGRKTAAIVSEVVNISQNKMGVMFFAATIQHANEIMESLPKELSAVVTGQTKKAERESIVNRFKNREFKYLVNVAVLTTGFDAPHVDVVAILRATESASLFQQIIGRGLRLHNDKEFCLILDYAENIERHGLEDDLFSPEIKTRKLSGEKFIVDAVCSSCGFKNEFSGRPNPENFEIDEEGYFVDLAGNRIDVGEGQFMPAHFGRRCNHAIINQRSVDRCNHRWSLKVCPECEEENDIASRYCTSCKTELVDPNEKLKIDYKKMKMSPNIMSTDKVLGWRCQEWISQRGNKSMRVDYTTEYRTFPVWYSPESNNIRSLNLWNNLNMAVFGKVAPSIDKFIEAVKNGFGEMPKTLTVKKEGDFFKVYSHNEPEDEEPV